MQRIRPGLKKKEKKKKERKEFRLNSDDFGFICAGVSNVAVIKETPNIKKRLIYNLSCLLQTYCHLSTNEKNTVR